MTYGDDLIKWRLGFIVWLDKNKCNYSENYPYGFFGIAGPLAIQYDFTEVN